MLFGYTSFILNGCASLSALLTRRGAEETHRIITFPMALMLDACLGGAEQSREQRLVFDGCASPMILAHLSLQYTNIAVYSNVQRAHCVWTNNNSSKWPFVDTALGMEWVQASRFSLWPNICKCCINTWRSGHGLEWLNRTTQITA